MDNEEWRDVVGYEGYYQVSNLGRVRSNWHKPGQILKGHTNRDGYCLVCLYRPGDKQRQAKVHRLVFQAFVGPLPDGCLVAHKNGDRADNRADNLEYYTLTSEQVDEIINLYQTGLYRKEQLATMFDASQSAISRIVNQGGYKRQQKRGR